MAPKKSKKLSKLDSHSPRLPYCADCPSHGRHVIPSEGPTPSRVLFISNYPTKEDAYRRLPMAGRAGKEFTYQYLPLASLSRFNVRVTHAVKCPMPDHAEPKGSVYTSCPYHHLHTEIAVTKPEVIVPMSADACKTLDPSIDLEYDHGHALPGKYGRWKGTVFPVYHPNSGLGDTTGIQRVREDFESLGRYMSTGIPPQPIDEYDGLEDYRLVTNAAEMRLVLAEHRDFVLRSNRIAIDTEYTPLNSGDIPYCYSFSPAPGCGFVVMLESLEATRVLNGWLESNSTAVVLHNAIADIAVLRAMGLDYPAKNPSRVRDTMVRLYHHALPRALKVAAYRLLGMRMNEFMDLALEYSRPVAIHYLSKVAELQFPKPYPDRPRVQAVHSKAKAIIKKAANDKSVSPWKLWDAIPDIERYPAEMACGAMPPPSVANFPMSALVPYAARDSDATLRLDLLLDGAEKEIRSKRR